MLLLVVLLGLQACAPPPPPSVVAMRDGVLLSTNVWFPPGTHPFSKLPTVLRRTPYGRQWDLGTVMGFLNNGYVVVSQDVRGRGGSQGTFLPWFDDARDGADTLAWIAQQPWSNGKVATFGGSAEGIVQWMAAPEAPEVLKCMVILAATEDIQHAILPGGAWREELITAWLKTMEAPQVLANWRGHEVRDAFWDPVRLDDGEIARVKVPVLQEGGFFDIFAADAVRSHARVQEHGGSGAQGDQFLVMGPWTHAGLNNAKQGQVTFNNDASCPDCGNHLVAFLDWCLKDGPRPSLPGVRYFVANLQDDGVHGDGVWKDIPIWPPASAPVELRLGGDGLLGTLPPRNTAPRALPVDPLKPIASTGGRNLTTAAGPMDQTSVDAQEGVALFSTPPVSAEMEIAGNVTARIWAHSATKDVDVVVRLEQVTKDGKAMLLADGIRRGRFAQGLDASRPLTPLEAVAFDVELGPVAFTLRPGHAVRIAISGSSAPRYEANTNTGEPLSNNASPVATTLTVLMDEAHPSVVVLPMVSGELPPG